MHHGATGDSGMPRNAHNKGQQLHVLGDQRLPCSPGRVSGRVSLMCSSARGWWKRQKEDHGPWAACLHSVGAGAHVLLVGCNTQVPPLCSLVTTWLECRTHNAQEGDVAHVADQLAAVVHACVADGQDVVKVRALRLLVLEECMESCKVCCEFVHVLSIHMWAACAARKCFHTGQWACMHAKHLRYTSGERVGIHRMQLHRLLQQSSQTGLGIP